MTQPDAQVTYWDYIRVPELLALQGGLEGAEERLSQDEVVFITVHQVYELWLKLALRDLVAARDLFAGAKVPDEALAGACRLLGRLRVVFRLMTHHFELIETMTPRDYLEFRDKLFPASGGQSVQFREVEVLFGIEESERMPFLAEGSYREVLREPDGSKGWAAKRMQARLLDRPHLKEAIEEWLFRTPINGSGPGDAGDAARVEAYREAYLAAHGRFLAEIADHACGQVEGAAEREKLRGRYAREAEAAGRFLRASEGENTAQRARRSRIRVAALYIESYRELPLLAWPRALLEDLIATEQAFVVFRQRHARMAERMIGRRVGTGGSTGVDYLDQAALRYRVFSDLWAVRTLLLPRDRLPAPEKTDRYGFRFSGS